jgi:Flp pilus assembly protein TadG
VDVTSVDGGRPWTPRSWQAAGVDHERGSLTLWLLGLAVTLLFLGGISLDLWRAFSERRALAGIADAAAVAGAGGIDEAHYRATGEGRLGRARAEALAQANLAAQSDTRSLTGSRVEAGPDLVTVTTQGRVELTLLQVLLPPQGLDITVTARSAPRGSP